VNRLHVSYFVIIQGMFSQLHSANSNPRHALPLNRLSKPTTASSQNIRTKLKDRNASDLSQNVWVRRIPHPV